MIKRCLLSLTLFTLGLAGAAEAQPLVQMQGGKASPGVVTAWKGAGKKITLSLKAGTDPQAVIRAIKSGVDGVRVKKKGGKLLVIGKKEADLLKALSGVELGGGDDTIGLLADAADTSESFDSGSSLRAKKTAKNDWSANPKDTVIAKVVGVKRGDCFPKVEVIVKVVRGPTEHLKKAAKKGTTLSLKPDLKMKKKKPVLKDPATVENSGAWFLQKGDTVEVQLGKRLKAQQIKAKHIRRR